MKKKTFLLALIAICLIILSGCKSDLEKVIEEERNFIDTTYTDMSILELNDEEFDSKYEKILEEHKGQYIKWTGEISLINSLFNELKLKEEGLPELVIDFEFDIADYLEENGYTKGDLITVSALLHDYNSIGDYWSLKNGRVEEMPKNAEKLAEEYRTAYESKKAIKNEQLIADLIRYDVITTEPIYDNSILYKIKIDEKFLDMSTLKNIVKELHTLENLENNKYDSLFIDFYLPNVDSYTSENTIAEAHIAYTQKGRGQAILEKENTFDIIIYKDGKRYKQEVFDL
ncbi:hypothetical protein SAMN05880501_103112 [Ureibacillus xyleni]|uniref:TATA-box binding protein n=1 Tax=Ureibacillus xyleni TaxID=614648 RepID=A0A285S6Y3_9BACL|nr:hypothetical protein [Ureibacillus xyleni]SOC02818.1 hypothetical protein SAMN05880501_103112 [Ureibacillus xyleni]